MTIRELRPEDINQLRTIHAQFYIREFAFPDFFNRFICAFAVLEDDQIISAGGVKAIAESIIITDKNLPVRMRQEALLKVLDASCYLASRSNFDQLHCWVQDEIWKNHLLSHNFMPCKGYSLFMDLPNG